MLVITRGCINHIHRLSIDYPSSNFKRGPVAPLGAVQLCTQRLQQLLRRRRHVTCEDRKKLTGCGWCGMGQNLEYVWNLIYLVGYESSIETYWNIWRGWARGHVAISHSKVAIFGWLSVWNLKRLALLKPSDISCCTQLTCCGQFKIALPFVKRQRPLISVAFSLVID